jgi:iron(III) transport system ATP-binding protein
MSIEFKNVSKRYGGAASPLVVNDISFVVPTGSLTTLLGPSGCGKTTTLRLIAGLETSSGGQVLIDGRDATHTSAAERNVSMVFQSYALFPHMSVLHNVGYGLSVSGVSASETTRRARGALESVGLTGFDARLPSELSGGQQQRVAVARSLVLEPSVLLFDEPLSNLDARLRRSMREEIRALQQRLKLTVAYVTHDQSEALAVSDQVIVLNAGHIAQAGTPQQLYEQPNSAFVAAFMGEAMLFDAQLTAEGGVRLGPLCLPGLRPSAAQSAAQSAANHGSLKVAVRPEAWLVNPHSAEHPHNAGETLPGRLTKCAYLGSFQELSVATSLGDIFVVCSDVTRTWMPGDTLSLRLGERGVALLA